MTKLAVMLAMLLSIAGGPAVASMGGETGRGRVICKCCSCKMACCVAKDSGRASELPAPVGHQMGTEVAEGVLTTRFAVLFAVGPTEARRAHGELFVDRHGPEGLAVSCIRLI